MAENAHIIVRDSTLLLNEFYLQEELSDVTLVVDGTRLPAHRFVLAAKSAYFRALLFGGLQESKQHEVVLQLEQSSLEAFQIILKFLYTNEIVLVYEPNETDFFNTIVYQVLCLAHEYNMQHVLDAITHALAMRIRLVNVTDLLRMSEFYTFTTLAEACYDFLDERALLFLRHASFLGLPEELLIKLLQRDTFEAPEQQIFAALQNWHVAQPSVDMQLILQHVRFGLIKPEFVTASLSALESTAQCQIRVMMDAAQREVSADNAPIARKMQRPRELREFFERHECENVFYAETLTAETPTSSNSTANIVIDLKTMRDFNYMRYTLADKSDLCQPIDIYASDNVLNWQHKSRNRIAFTAMQSLILPPTTARYIRISADHLSLRNVEVLLAPEFRMCNVATYEMAAEVCYSPRVKSINNHDLLAVQHKHPNIASYTRVESGALFIQFSGNFNFYTIFAEFHTWPTSVKVILRESDSSRESVFTLYENGSIMCGVTMGFRANQLFIKGQTNGENYLEVCKLQCLAKSDDSESSDSGVPREPVELHRPRMPYDPDESDDSDWFDEFDAADDEFGEPDEFNDPFDYVELDPWNETFDIDELDEHYDNDEQPEELDEYYDNDEQPDELDEYYDYNESDLMDEHDAYVKPDEWDESRDFNELEEFEEMDFYDEQDYYVYHDDDDDHEDAYNDIDGY